MRKLCIWKDKNKTSALIKLKKEDLMKLFNKIRFLHVHETIVVCNYVNYLSIKKRIDLILT